MLSLIRLAPVATVRCRGSVILRNSSSFKSAISLEKLYPGSSLKLSTPTHTPNTDKIFDGYIPLSRLDITYSGSSGPGGQNVNKVHTKVDLRFRLSDAEWINPVVKEKLAEIYKNKMTKDGYMVFKSDLTRSQQLNVADCLQKLRAVIRSVSQEERKPLAETEERMRRRHEKAARERLIVKRINSQKLAERRPPTINDL